MKQNILIYDLETSSVDVNEAVPRVMGFKSSIEEGFKWTSNIDEMVQIFNNHDVIVGYNNKDYDDEILKKYGASTYGKVNVDLYEIIHGKGFGNDLGRKTIMQTPDDENLGKKLHRKSLDATSQALKGPRELEVDYSLFQKDFSLLDETSQNKALEYLKRDIEMTEYVYTYCENFFKDFRDGGIELDGKHVPFLTEDQVRKKIYLTASVASLVYKMICNLAGIEERYGNGESIDYGGGFVADPAQEVTEGNIYALDYSSLYPHIMIQMNLYGRCKEVDNCWKGDGISETIGAYNTKTMSGVSYVLQQMYKQRKELKKQGNPKEYTLKIIINTIYGLLGNPSFESVCDFTAAADCTRIGRQWVNAAREHFTNKGYTVLYTDTDSVYLVDNFNDKQSLLEAKDEHINHIKSTVPFPQDTFDMDIDDEMEYIAFFKGSDGNLLKKNYLYVTKNKELVIKGMQIIKSNATPLSQHVFEKYIKPEILYPTRNKEKRHKWSKSQIETWVEDELRQDITLASVFYKVKSPESYANAQQIQYQIANHPLYGEGSHQMLKLRTAHNKGAGTNMNYVGIQYYDEISLAMLDVSKTMKELEPFIEETQNTLFDFAK